MNVAEAAQIAEDVLKENGDTVRSLFLKSLSTNLNRRTGLSRRQFVPKILRDKKTNEAWGLSFSTVRYIYMHHHGMEPQSVNRSGRSYNHPGYRRTSLLTDPADEGAKIIADELAKRQADYMVTGIRF